MVLGDLIAYGLKAVGHNARSILRPFKFFLFCITIKRLEFHEGGILICEIDFEFGYVGPESGVSGDHEPLPVLGFGDGHLNPLAGSILFCTP